MSIKDCIDFANQNTLCYLATVEVDQPRVRALRFWYADETGFYFQTASIKEFYHQLKENPKTEVCFIELKDSAATTLRVAGKVEFLDDRSVKERALEDRPFLKNMGMTADSPEFIIFRISHGKACFWTMETNLNPKEFIEF